MATLRTIRELFRQERKHPGPWRAWDLALRTGVTPQGSADSLERLNRSGLVEVFPSAHAGQARTFRLDRTHPLITPLKHLFEAERLAVRRPSTRMRADAMFAAGYEISGRE